MQVRPSHRLVITLSRGGVQLLNPQMALPLLLDYDDLEAIIELNTGEYTDFEDAAAAVAARTGATTEKVSQFYKALRNRKRIRPMRKRPRLDTLGANAAHIPSTQWRADRIVTVRQPQTFRQNGDRFELVDHDGNLVLSLDSAELLALGAFSTPRRLDSAMAEIEGKIPAGTVDANHLGDILATLDAAGLLNDHESEIPPEMLVQEGPSRNQSCKKAFAQQAKEQDEREAKREQETGVVRTKVIPVSFDTGVPAALGMIVAYAKEYEEGRLENFYDFRLDWFWDDERLPGFTERPAIYLYSNYLWSHEGCIGVSEKVKELSPHSINIHGGPDTPKYEEDAEKYFANHPHVDIIVRGEGEATASEVLDKLQAVIGQDNPDLSVLADVAGISYRYNGKIYRNPDRERIMDLDTIPSPYIAGLFDAYIGVPKLHVTLETNRGCPYGCTFCDWGSATTSKIRKFDLDRIFGEIEWCSTSKIQSVSVADANFGVFERDVAIAERVAHFKGTTGWPEAFGGSYAKNSTKYLQQIIKVMADAGILAQGVLSLQTMDDDTLTAIKRSNIKVEKYDALANEMRNSNLQLTVELMMGLPGATMKGFVEDLQQCIDRDIPARVNHTTMLVNSPMNNPDYRAEHQIETGQELGPGKMPILVSTKTYTREDMERMLALRMVYMMADNFGQLRLTGRFVRQQTGMDEMELYGKLFDVSETPPMQLKYPLIGSWASFGHELMAPVYSWTLFLDEIKDFLVNECNVPDDSALETIIATQKAVLPAYGREYPFKLELKHDVAAWYEQMLAAKAANHWKDWQMVVPPLSEFGPGELEVSDHDGWVTSMLGCDIELSSAGVNWDMDSSIARASVQQDFTPAWYKEEDVIQVG